MFRRSKCVLVLGKSPLLILIFSEVAEQNNFRHNAAFLVLQTDQGT
jgi:hypothetical protein